MQNQVFRFHLIIALILSGGYAIIAQVIFVRELLVVFYGNELCFGIIFASWLGGISLGAFLGSRIIHRFRHALTGFLLLQLGMSLIFSFQVYLTRTMRSFFEILPGESFSFLSMVYGSIFSVLPFSILVGCAFPFACMLFTEKKERGASGIGWVYIIESLGSMTGGVVLTFYLIMRFHSFQITGILSCLLLVNCFVLSILSGLRRSIKFFWGGLFLAFLVLCSFFMLTGKVETLNEYSILKRWGTFGNEADLVESVDSRYQNIAVTYREGQYSIFGNGQYITAFPNDYESARFAHFVLTQHPSPEKVLLIGGGTGGIVREMLKHSISTLHYVEIDPKLIRIMGKFLPQEDKKALKDKRVTIFYTDGRNFVKRSQKKYDVIVINVPDPSTAMLNRFYTTDFFKEARSILEEDGVLVTGVSSGVNYIGEEVGDYSGSVYHSLLKIFPFVLATPGDKNYFFAASRPNIVSSNIDIVSSRYDERHIQSKFFSKVHFELLFPAKRIEFVERSLQKRTSLPLNTDLRPITYFFNQILQEAYSGERGKFKFLQMLRHIEIQWMLFLIILFVTVRIIYVVLRKDRAKYNLKFNCLFVIVTTGITGMSMEILLIFLFQNIYGYIYHMMGLIVAAFMFGLAFGGWVMNMAILKYKRLVRILFFIEVSLLLYIFALPILVTNFFPLEIQSQQFYSSSEYLFVCLVGIAGILPGLEFPIVGKILLDLGGDTGRTAGVIDSFDHLGAFVGALFTGAAFVPLFGIQGTCFLIGSLKIASTVLLFFFMAGSYDPRYR